MLDSFVSVKSDLNGLKFSSFHDCCLPKKSYFDSSGFNFSSNGLLNYPSSIGNSKNGGLYFAFFLDEDHYLEKWRTSIKGFKGSSD